mgnify:FL=1
MMTTSNKDTGRYTVVRFYKSPMRKDRIMYKNLTLEQAKEHCRREDTPCEGQSFDGYRRQ